MEKHNRFSQASVIHIHSDLCDVLYWSCVTMEMLNMEVKYQGASVYFLLSGFHFNEVF